MMTAPIEHFSLPRPTFARALVRSQLGAEMQTSAPSSHAATYPDEAQGDGSGRSNRTSDAPPPNSTTRPVEPIDILLVDDEPRNLDALEAVLDNGAYRLLRAENADRALRLLLEHHVAAIVLDIKMPHIDGFELARIIKGTKRFRQVPILFLTAHLVEDADAVLGYDAGAVDYLTKPFNPHILRHKVGVYADLFQKARALADLNEKLEQRVSERTAELEQSEQALREASRHKDEFMAVLAHELRNPLVPLRTGLDLLMQLPHVTTPTADTIDEVTTVSRTLSAMNRQLDHIVRLVDDLLDISRIGSGVIELKLERVNLTALIEQAAETAQTFLQRKALTLTVNAPSSLEAVVDPTRVSQIVRNLLHNASKFTPARGTIRLELAVDGPDFVVRVLDSGIGIEPSRIEQVFEMFARSDDAPSSDRGAGIGLALARRLAQLHGGDLTATSPGPGRGSTFTLRAPRACPKAAVVRPVSLTVPAPQAATSLRIVVIEDNEDAGETLATLLTSLGNTVTLARSGREGLAQVMTQRPELVLCDIGLPDMSGHDVCRRVRESCGDDYQPTMVAISGWGQAVDRRRTRDAGFERHLVKPVTLDALRQVLSETAAAWSCVRLVSSVNQ